MVDGKLEGLPSKYITQLEKLDGRVYKADNIIATELAKTMAEISTAISRQLGVILSRSNEIIFIIVGSSEEIVIPLLSRFQLISGRLRGLRFIRTDLRREKLDEDDLTDLALLRLDAISLIHVSNGLPKSIETAYLLPPNSDDKSDDKSYGYLTDSDVYNQQVGFIDFITSLDNEMKYKADALHKSKNKSYAVLTGVFKDKVAAEQNMAELKELARSAEVEVLDTIVQIRSKVDAKYIVGLGKLKEIVIRALSKGAEFIIYDNALTPSQSRAIADFTEIKVIDRTQLILDIFARRAKSNDGKIIVELAQLKYMLPRLGLKDDALSRLSGGIGGKGPGETKLEVDKRRVTDRIAFLSKKLKVIESGRETRRVKRVKRDTPTISVIGYTNAGKTTLINNLTKSDIYADNLMFATLDTTSKRIRFPEEKEIIITDTVGFIRDLPKNLEIAFKSTLEEISASDLLIHLVDISDTTFKNKIKAVDKVIDDIVKEKYEMITVFNKVDLLDEESLSQFKEEYKDAVFLSATERISFKALTDKLWHYFFRKTGTVI